MFRGRSVEPPPRNVPLREVSVVSDLLRLYKGVGPRVVRPLRGPGGCARHPLLERTDRTMFEDIKAIPVVDIDGRLHWDMGGGKIFIQFSFATGGA